MDRRSLVVLRVILGVYFVMSGLASLLHFAEWVEVVEGLKLRLWGLGFGWSEGVGPLPRPLSTAVAWVLPPLEIIQGALFAAGVRVRWTGASMIAVLVPIVLAFGVLPPGLLDVNTMSFNKDIVFMAAIAVIMWHASPDAESGDATLST